MKSLRLSKLIIYMFIIALIPVVDNDHTINQ